MSDNQSDEKWAVNLAFVGNKETVKKVVKLVNEMEESGTIQDFNMIEGPFSKLQDLLKDRKQNLIAPPPMVTAPTAALPPVTVPTQRAEVPSATQLSPIDEIDDDSGFTITLHFDEDYDDD
ncbi:hypothetical protein [Undibacterium sp.]|uniref:hypothetical protein n=1 Tax=Undibacterium sp. TaxID=1914977 RepID=UPI0027317758|nr:hypothetical protein [Undibacterium sp.]MDP1977618.1 hypothetical protein [Undibacterium sp.]